jgi:sugar/nucleoside kinase (ribokinase family)
MSHNTEIHAEIIAIGSLYLDINIRGVAIAASKFPDREYSADAYECALGGSSVIFAQTAAALGMVPCFIGKIGTDEFGAIVKRKLAESGVMAHVIEDHSVSTSLGLNETAPNGETYMTVVNQASRALREEEFEETIAHLMSTARFLYIGGLLKMPQLIQAFGRLAVRAQTSGLRVALDHGRVASSVTQHQIDEVKTDVLPNVDYYLPSLDEAATFWGTQDEHALFDAIGKQTRALTVVKMGRAGAATSDTAGIKRIAPPIPLNTGAVVGAGDRFNAGFLAASHRGLSPLEAVKYANATAALGIQGMRISHDAVLRLCASFS